MPASPLGSLLTPQQQAAQVQTLAASGGPRPLLTPQQRLHVLSSMPYEQLTARLSAARSGMPVAGHVALAALSLFTAGALAGYGAPAAAAEASVAEEAAALGIAQTGTYEALSAATAANLAEEMARLGIAQTGGATSSPAWSLAEERAMLGIADTGYTMNFSDLLRTAAKQAVQGFASNVLSSAVQSTTPPGYQTPAPVAVAGMGNFEFIPGLTQPIYPGAQPQQASVGTALTRLLGGAGSMVAGAVGVVRSAAGKILRVVLPGGRSVSRRKAVELAKRVGIDAAAVALGITAVEMAQMVLDEGTTKRRGRSITAAQLRTTRSTMRRVKSMHRQIASYCGGSGFGRSSSRRRAPGRARHLAGPIIVNQD